MSWQRILCLSWGAGPAGLAAATELARRGKKIRIIDQNPGPSIYSKALGINARSLDLPMCAVLSLPFVQSRILANMSGLTSRDP